MHLHVLTTSTCSCELTSGCFKINRASTAVPICTCSTLLCYAAAATRLNNLTPTTDALHVKPGSTPDHTSSPNPQQKSTAEPNSAQARTTTERLAARQKPQRAEYLTVWCSSLDKHATPFITQFGGVSWLTGQGGCSSRQAISAHTRTPSRQGPPLAHGTTHQRCTRANYSRPQQDTQ